MKYSIVIPCYNEAENIAPLMRALYQYDNGTYDVEFIFVENGSQDTTRKEINRVCRGREHVKIAYVEKNKGYGYGLLAGLHLAEGDYVGWMHADLQVTPKEIFRFISYAETQGTGKKYFLKGIRKNRSRLDCFFTNAMTVFETLVFQKYMYDIGGIPVLFHRDLLKELKQPPYSFTFELYTYLKAKEQGFVIKRAPVRFKKRKNGASSWNKGLHSKIALSIGMMRESIKIRIIRQ